MSETINYSRVIATLLPNARRFYGDFESVQNVNDAFGLYDEKVLRDGEILFASYDNEEYDGSAFLLYTRDGVLYEVIASHCSCYGLSECFEPEDTTWAALAMRSFMGENTWERWSGVDELRALVRANHQ